MEKRVYRENPLKVAVRVVGAVIALLAGSFLLFTFVLPSAPSRRGISVDMVILSLPIGVMLLTLLVAWLVIKKRTVTIDASGCEVFAKRPGSSGQFETERFLWHDVTGTFLRSETFTIRNSTQTNYLFGVYANGREFFLMERTFLDENLKNLIADVNRATPHLGYAWEECRADETRRILEAVPPFCKVELQPGAAQTAQSANQTAAAPNINANLAAQFATTPNQTVANPAVPKIQTKKQKKQNAIGSLIAALVLTLAIAGFMFWDYSEQKKRYDYQSRVPSFDFKTGKTIPKPPPPFEYVFGDSGLMPVIIICGAVSALMFVGSIFAFNEYRKTIETPEMVAEDARREAIENSPEVKEAGRGIRRAMLFRILVFSPIIVMLFFKTHYTIYFGYLVIAAIVIGIHTYVLMRRR